VSEPAPAGAGVGAAPVASRDWEIRPAGQADVEAVAAGVRELLLELGGEPPEELAMQATVRALVDSPSAGIVLVAQAREELVGLLAASWQMAIHVPGSYALIQDLWVEPGWRSRALGGELMAALFELARARRMRRVEVGLPRESFARFAATESFYLRHGFVANGPRLRRSLA
jgi:GNAT superfamily N-acetyltransferase